MKAIFGEQCDKFRELPGRSENDGRGTTMARPVMGRRNKVRVEFSLPAELAAEIYQWASEQNPTLSQTGERLFAHALSEARGVDSSFPRCDNGPDRNRGNA